MNSLVPVLAALSLASGVVFAASEAIFAPPPQPAPAAFGAVLFIGMVQARHSSLPAVRKLIRPSSE